MKKFLSLILILLVLHSTTFANKIVLTKGGDNGLIATGISSADTLVVDAAQNQWNYLYFGNCSGLSESQPLVIINEGNADLYAGFTLENCHYIKLTGFGNRTRTYGFRIKSTGGYGSVASPAISIKAASSDIIIEGIETIGVGYLAWIKNEIGDYQSNADKGQPYWYPTRFTNIELRYLKADSTYQDLIYSGSSDPLGNSRWILFDNGITNTISIPTTHPTTLTFTVPTGKLYYVVGVKVDVISSGGQVIRGNISSYNSATGALQITTTGNTGTGTFSSWTINGYPLPTGLAGVSYHDITAHIVGRSMFQLGRTDSQTTKFPVNLIYNNTGTVLGRELNDQQGFFIAAGTAVTNLEAHHNISDSTLKNGYLGYHFGQVYLHDNKFSHVGNVTIDTTRLVVNMPIQIRLDRAAYSLTYSATVKPQGTKVQPTTDWYFIKYANVDAGDNVAIWNAYWTGSTTTGLSARQTFKQYFTTAVAWDNTNQAYTGFGGNSTPTDAAVTLPTDGRLPYSMGGHFMNAFDDNITLYGSTKGKSSIIVQRDTVVSSTDATNFFLVGSTHNTYDSTKTYFCNNVFNGASVTSGNIYIDPLATSFGYRTDCSTATWNGLPLGSGGGGGGTTPGSRYILKLPKAKKLTFKPKQ